MRLFLESANLQDVRAVASWGVLSGVTTTPTLLADEGVAGTHRIGEICSTIPGQVTASVDALTRDEMVAAGKETAALADNVVVQFPVNVDSLAACRILSEAGVPVSMVLVFSTAQAIMCANAGARYCAPFVSRVDDIGGDGIMLLEEIAQVFAVQGYSTEILAMSLQSPTQVVAAARAGADIASVPYDVFSQMVSNPLTDLCAERFAEDWARPVRAVDAHSPQLPGATTPVQPSFEPGTQAPYSYEPGQPAQQFPTFEPGAGGFEPSQG